MNITVTAKKKAALRPSHPGDTLKEDFMVPLGLSAYAVAKAIGSTPITISLITRGKRAISAEMALRLARYTGASAEFWFNLQAKYDLDVARDHMETVIHQQIVPLEKAHLRIRHAKTAPKPAAGSSQDHAVAVPDEEEI